VFGNFPDEFEPSASRDLATSQYFLALILTADSEIQDQ
jgi:hypothetical protein